MIFARIRCITKPTPARRVTPPWNGYMAKFDPGWEGNTVWQTGLPALAGRPTYHVNVINLNWEFIRTGGLPHLSGLRHLPGVPHLHVNRPLVKWCRVINVRNFNVQSRAVQLFRRSFNSSKIVVPNLKFYKRNHIFQKCKETTNRTHDHLLQQG